MTSDTKEHGEKVMKPCPFCGNENLREGQGDTYFIECEPCYDNFGTHVCAEGAARLDAVAMWNRRQRPTPERPPHQGLIEALVYCAEDMDGWIAATKCSLSDPRFGIAIRDHEKFIAESRADLAARERHIVELRNHIAALESAVSATSGSAASVAKGKP